MAISESGCLSFTSSGDHDRCKGGIPIKKFLCLCLMLSLFVACSSEKDAKPNPETSPAMENAAAPAAPEAITSLSGEYVLTETEPKKTKAGSQELTCTTTHTFKLSFITNNWCITRQNQSRASIHPRKASRVWRNCIMRMRLAPIT